MLTLLTSLFTCSNIGHFLHITDIHYDPLYQEGSPTKCALGNTGLGCCHKYDLPLIGNHPASRWGDYNCDASSLLVNETFKWIKDNINPLDFIFYTGDSAGHHDLSNLPHIVNQSMSDINNMMETNFPGIPTYNNLGNHDTWPIDQTLSFEYPVLLDSVADLWYPYLNAASIDSIRKGGYYTTLLSNHTRLVSFNSIYYGGNNIEKRTPENDSQFIWLRNTLEYSRQQSQTVWLLSHIFPTAGESTVNYNMALKSVVRDYKDVIRYQWFGHSHNDQFVLYRDVDNTTGKETYFGTAVVGASLMPDKRFPSFRIYQYNQTDFSLIDYTQYVANLTDVIVRDKLMYKDSYSFRKEYGLNGLDTVDYVELYMGIKNETLKKKFLNHYIPGIVNTDSNIEYTV